MCQTNDNPPKFNASASHNYEGVFSQSWLRWLCEFSHLKPFPSKQCLGGCARCEGGIDSIMAVLALNGLIKVKCVVWRSTCLRNFGFLREILIVFCVRVFYVALYIIVFFLWQIYCCVEILKWQYVFCIEMGKYDFFMCVVFIFLVVATVDSSFSNEPSWKKIEAFFWTRSNISKIWLNEYHENSILVLDNIRAIWTSDVLVNSSALSDRQRIQYNF